MMLNGVKHTNCVFNNKIKKINNEVGIVQKINYAFISIII